MLVKLQSTVCLLHKIATEAKTNPKAFWQYINSKRKCKEGISSLKKDDGTYTNNDKEKAEVLNDLFIRSRSTRPGKNLSEWLKRVISSISCTLHKVQYLLSFSLLSIQSKLLC